MKRKAVMLFAGIGLVLAVAAGCVHPSDPNNGSSETTGKVQVSLSAAPPSGAIAPADLGITRYELTFTRSGYSHAPVSIETAGNSASASVDDLRYGNWTITAAAYAGNTALAEKSGTVEVPKGGMAALGLALEPRSENGTFAYDITAAGAGSGNITFPGSQQAEITLTFSSDAAADSASLAGGVYSYAVTVTKDGQSADKTGALWVYPGLTSTLTHTFNMATDLATPVSGTALVLDSLFDAPARGAAISAIAAIDKTEYTGTAEWQDAEGEPITPGGAFAAWTTYKAVLSLTAESGYTFAGLATDAFSYTGAESVVWDPVNKTVTITFEIAGQAPTLSYMVNDAGTGFENKIAATSGTYVPQHHGGAFETYGNYKVFNSKGTKTGTTSQITGIWTSPVWDNYTDIGYVDLGTPSGNLMKGLNQYTVETWLCLPSNAQIDRIGQYVWAFSDQVTPTNAIWFNYRDITLLYKYKNDDNLEDDDTRVDAGWEIANTKRGELGQWHQVVVTKDNTSVTVYVDGASIYSGTLDASLNSLADDTLDHNILGGELYPNALYDQQLFDTRYYAFNIYSEALSADNITHLYDEDLAANLTAAFYLPAGDLSAVSGNLTLVTELPHGITVEWSSNSAALSAEGVVTRPGALQQNAEVTLTAVFRRNGSIIATRNIAVTVLKEPGNDAKVPVISAPYSLEDASYPRGTDEANVTALSVTVNGIEDGDDFTYQWYVNTENAVIIDDSHKIADADDASYKPPADVMGTFYYYVLITNTNENKAAVGSTIATTKSRVVRIDITVDAAAPLISEQPAPTTSYTKGDPAAALQVKASASDGGDLSYQWYRNTSSSTSGGTPVSGSAISGGSEYTPVVDTMGTLHYYVVVTNTNNNVNGKKTQTAVSTVATVTVLVNAEAPGLDETGLADATYLEGGGVTDLSVSATVSDGGSLSYRWYSNSADSTSGGAVAQEWSSSSTFTPPVDSTKRGDTYYYVEVRNTNSEVNGNQQAVTKSSKAAKITVTFNAQTPSITAQPQQNAYQTGSGGVTPLSVTAEVTDGGALSFQWYKNSSANTDGAAAVDATSADATSSTYTPSVSSAGTTYYYVVVTNTNSNATASTTASVTSSIVSIIVTDSPVTNAAMPDISASALADATYAKGAGSVTDLSVTASSTDDGLLTYQWYVNTTNSTAGSSLVPSETAAAFTPPVSTAGEFYYYVIVTNTKEGVNGQPTAAWTSSLAHITVTESLTITITVQYGEVVIAGSGENVISKTGAGGKPTQINLSVSGYTEPAWYVDGGETPAASDNEFSVVATSYNAGPHRITFKGKINGDLVTRTISFTVLP